MCRWSKSPEEVEFVLSVLERLAERYGNRKGLWGIEAINEPVMDRAWKLFDVPNRYPAADKDMAEGSGPCTLEFLKDFYVRAYDRMRKFLPEEKYIVIHDGFELLAWKDFMQEEKYVNVVLDTHQYLMMAEAEGCEQNVEAYQEYIREHYEKEIQEMEQYFPVICGEWCLFNSYACGCDTKGGRSVLNGEEGSSGSTGEKADLSGCGRGSVKCLEKRKRIFLLELQASYRYGKRKRLDRMGQLGSGKMCGFRMVSD